MRSIATAPSFSQPLASQIFDAFDDDEEDELMEAPRAAAQPAQTIVTERIVEKVIEKIRANRSANACRTAANLYPESDRRRPQGLSAHRRI